MTEDIIIYKAQEYVAGNISDCRRFLGISFCREIILQPGEGISFSECGIHQLFILPVVGGVTIEDKESPAIFIGAEQYYWAVDNQSMRISNPYPENAISCIIIGFRNRRTVAATSAFGTIDFGKRNWLATIIDFRHLKISIGIFDGRKEALYTRSADGKGLYCLVIRGVFEVAGRLLHPKDALSFIRQKEIGIEALSEDAIILCVETT